MTRTERSALVVATILVASIAALVLAGSLRAPLGYDEAYNLQIPMNLSTEGRYATDGTLFSRPGLGLFDHFITTGPTLLLPTAGVLFVAGDEVWAGRLAASAFYVLLLVMAWRAGRGLGGRWAGLGAVGGALSLDLRTDGGLGMNGAAAVLGEVPATVCILAAALVVTRRPFVAGALLGLAVLSKLLALLALPAFVAAVILARRSDDVSGPSVSALIRMLGGTGAVLASWGVVQVTVMGWTDWLDRSERYLGLFVFGGSGLVDDASYQFARWPAFADSWWSWPAAVVLVGGIATVLALSALRHIEGAQLGLGSSEQVGLIVAAGGTAGLTLVWWWALAGRVLGRYLVTPLLLVSVLSCALAVVAIQHLVRLIGRRRAILAGTPAAVALAVLVGGHVVASWGDHGSLDEQKRVAAVVRATSEGRVGGVGWFQNPEIAYLTGVQSIGDPRPDELMLLSSDYQRLEPESYRSELERCGEVLLRSDQYLLCRIR